GILIERKTDVFSSGRLSIYICAKPDCEVTFNNPRFNKPRPSKGYWVKVWYNGRWIKRGVWENKITEMINLLINELKLIEEMKTKEKEREKQLENEEYRKLVEAWSD
ncbi:hypothetical protein J7M07_04370, partial [bacterium]|nr:hypothetical protein [bacterium]